MEEENKPTEMKKSGRFIVIFGIVLVFFVAALITNGFGIIGRITGNVISENTLSIGNSPVLGDKNAPITIYEFSDFSCAFCAATNGKNSEYISILKSRDPKWEAPIPMIIQDYVNSGKAKIVFKYYPGHGEGRAAQNVAWALNDQNLFWQFSDAAFDNQKDVSDLEKMKMLAISIGADPDALENSLNSNRHASKFYEDEEMGKSAGIKGTPTFFINGIKLEGARSYTEFKKIIDSELAKKA